MTIEKTLEIKIPFTGFYNSVSSSEIDYEIETYFSDIDIDINSVFCALDFNTIYDEYAKEYAKNFAHEFNLNLTFNALVSPREYNFATDRIFCSITESDVLMMYKNVNHNELSELVKKEFTSRSGFCSFYSNNLSDWGDVLTWDFNQLGILLELYVGEVNELDLMESSLSNGFIYNLIENQQLNLMELTK